MTTTDDQDLAAQAIAGGNYVRAVELLKPLAENGSEYALISLGWIHEHGKVGPPDKDTARIYYERATVIGSSSAHLYLAHVLLSEGNIRKARDVLETGSRLGSVECKEQLRNLTEADVEKEAAQLMDAGNYKLASPILQNLSKNRSKYALISLGWIYETGALGAPDYEAALTNYELAVAEGSASACFDLGRLFARQHNDVKARRAFETGAERGDIACMSRIGRMMVEGRGGPVDQSVGVAWLERAATQGNVPAQRTLLGIREDNAKSALEKLSIKKDIALLARRGAAEFAKNPNSEKLR